MRDYGIESSVWDGVDGCEHEWGEDIRVLRHKKGETNPGKESWYKDKNQISERGGNFCRLCGAWRGCLGLEPHPSDFVRHLVGIFELARGVLKDTGSLWVNLGDSYYGNSSGEKREKRPELEGCASWRKQGKSVNMKIKSDGTWLQPKQLMLMPHRFAIAMQDAGWVLRNDCVWFKRNPMPSSVKDRLNVCKEYVFHFVKKAKGYYYDLDAIRSPHLHTSGWEKSGRGASENTAMRGNGNMFNPSGKNPGDCYEYSDDDVWRLSTQPLKDAHFATFPEKLILKPILATVPGAVCQKCGTARRRISEIKRELTRPGNYSKCDGMNLNASSETKKKRQIITDVTTIGWTVCSCTEPEYKPGVVLDIFGGSGTVGVVAIKNDRDYILIEAKGEYCDMTRKRLNMELLKYQGEKELEDN